jgi:hypothetical protein
METKEEKPKDTKPAWTARTGGSEMFASTKSRRSTWPHCRLYQRYRPKADMLGDTTSSVSSPHLLEEVKPGMDIKFRVDKKKNVIVGINPITS